MGSLKEIRNRIKTVKNTRKITSAMSRIAAARLVKAQHAAIAARPYGERLEDVVYDLMAAADPAEGGALSPLMPRPARAGEVRRVALVLVTADRGLCGGFNANANRAARTFLAERKAQGYEVPVLTVGRKGKSYLSHERHAPFLQHHPSAELETVIARAKDVAHEATALYTGEAEGGPVEAVFLIYNHFKSVLTQEVKVVQLLPFETVARVGAPTASAVFEPDARSLLAHLLPVALESRIQQALFNSVAAEIAARRMAMDSATDNASELIGELTLIYNRERQAAITKELMEIIGGAEALKG